MESIHTPNISISAIKNPNNNLNDSNIKILAHHNPKVEKIQFDKSPENSNFNSNININYEKNYLFAALAQKKEENKNDKNIVNKNNSIISNKKKDHLISEQVNLIEKETPSYDDNIINKKNSTIKSIKNKNVKAEFDAKDLNKFKLDFEPCLKAKSENLNDNFILPVKSSPENSLNESKLMEEDIVISEINEHLKTPNTNIKQVSNHFLNRNSFDLKNKKKENIDKKENENTTNKEKKQIIKFNNNEIDNDNNNLIDIKVTKFKSKSDLSNYNSKNNELSRKSNSVSNFNSNENLQNLLVASNKIYKAKTNNFTNNDTNEDYDNINFKKKDNFNIFNSGNSNQTSNNDNNNDRSINENFNSKGTNTLNKYSYTNNSNNNNNNFNVNNIKLINKNTPLNESSTNEFHFDCRPSRIYNGNFSNVSDLKGFNSNGNEKENLKKMKSCSENIGSVRSRTADPFKDDVGLGMKRKTTLRQKETIIFNQEDILDFLHFKEWRKKMKMFFDKLKDLIVNFSSCLYTIDQSYSWIQKRFLKENLKRIKKSHKKKKEM